MMELVGLIISIVLSITTFFIWKSWNNKEEDKEDILVPSTWLEGDYICHKDYENRESERYKILSISPDRKRMAVEPYNNFLNISGKQFYSPENCINLSLRERLINDFILDNKEYNEELKKLNEKYLKS